MKPLYSGFAILFCLLGCSKPATEDSDKKTTIAVDLVTCKTGDVDQTLDLEGSFETGQGSLAKLSAGSQGRIKAIAVREGDLVQTGQLLASLDPSIQTAQEQSAQAALQSAQVQVGQSKIQLSASQADQANSLASAQIGLKQAKAEGQNAIDQAQYTLEQSQVDLARLQNGARPLEIAQAHEATIQASATVQRAKTELDRDEGLWPQGYIAKKQLDDARTSLQTAVSIYNAAQDSEQLLKAGARPEELKAARSKVASAADALASARTVASYQLLAAQSTYAHAKTGALSVAGKAEDISNGQALAAQKAADLASTRATARLLEIRAPFDGKIIKCSAVVGDPADTTTVLFLVQKQGSHADFVATGLPDQIASVTPEMRVTVDVKAQTFAGRVLSTSPPDATGNLGTVRITVEGVPTSGTFGTAHIRLKRLNAVVLVPDTAVVQKDGKSVVFKNSNGTAKSTEVTLGPRSAGSTAILAGLKAGDSIVASGGNELDDGAAISSAAKDKADKDEGDKG